MKLIKEKNIIPSDKLQTELKINLASPNLIWILIISIILVNFGLGIALPIFPDILLTMNLGKTSVLGLILGSFALGQVIFAPVIGYLSDTRHGNKRILQFSFFGFSMTNFLIPLFLNDISIIIIIRFLQGISVAGIIPVSLSLVNQISQSQNRTRNYTLIYVGVNFGWMLGSILGGFLYGIGGLATPFLLSDIFSIFGFVLIIVLIPESKKIYQNENKILISNENQFRGDLKTLLFVPGGFVIFLLLQYIIFIDSWAWSFIKPGLAFYSIETIGISVFEFGFYLGFFNFVILIGQIFLCRLEQFNKDLLLFLAGMFHFVGYCFLVISTNLIDLLIMAIITGIGMSILLPTISLYITEISLEQNQGFNLSFLTTTSHIAGILGLFIGGFLGDLISFHLILIISALSFLSVSILIIIQKLFFRSSIINH